MKTRKKSCGLDIIFPSELKCLQKTRILGYSFNLLSSKFKVAFLLKKKKNINSKEMKSFFPEMHPLYSGNEVIPNY